LQSILAECFKENNIDKHQWVRLAFVTFYSLLCQRTELTPIEKVKELRATCADTLRRDNCHSLPPLPIPAIKDCDQSVLKKLREYGISLSSASAFGSASASASASAVRRKLGGQKEGEEDGDNDDEEVNKEGMEDGVEEEEEEGAVEPNFSELVVGDLDRTCCEDPTSHANYQKHTETISTQNFRFGPTSFLFSKHTNSEKIALSF
jgi:hypothetical protein